MKEDKRPALMAALGITADNFEDLIITRENYSTVLDLLREEIIARNPHDDNLAHATREKTNHCKSQIPNALELKANPKLQTFFECIQTLKAANGATDQHRKRKRDAESAPRANHSFVSSIVKQANKSTLSEQSTLSELGEYLLGLVQRFEDRISMLHADPELSKHAIALVKADSNEQPQALANFERYVETLDKRLVSDLSRVLGLKPVTEIYRKIPELKNAMNKPERKIELEACELSRYLCGNSTVYLLKTEGKEATSIMIYNDEVEVADKSATRVYTKNPDGIFVFEREEIKEAKPAKASPAEIKTRIDQIVKDFFRRTNNDPEQAGELVQELTEPLQQLGYSDVDDVLKSHNCPTAEDFRQSLIAFSEKLAASYPDNVKHPDNVKQKFDPNDQALMHRIQLRILLQLTGLTFRNPNLIEVHDNGDLIVMYLNQNLDCLFVNKVTQGSISLNVADLPAKGSPISLSFYD